MGALRTAMMRSALALLVPGMEAAVEEAAYELEPLTVRAWHFEGVDLQFPGEVRVIDRETILESFSSNLPELLEREANVRFDSFNGKASEGQVSLRGFGENSGLRVLVVIDGQRLNRPDMGGVEWQLLPLENIETVEVIRGGQNVLYGNYALSGVIRITTRHAGETHSHLQGKTGSDGFFHVSADHAGRGQDRFWNVAAQVVEDNGYRENSRTWNRGISGSAGLEGGNGRLSMSARYAEGYARFPGPLMYEAFQHNPRQSKNSGREETDYRSGQVTAIWDGRHEWGASRANASLNLRELEWALEGLYAASEQLSATLSPRVRLGGEANFLMLGMDLIRDEVDFRDFLDADHRYLGARAKLGNLSAGPYAFAQRTLAGFLSLSGGIRYEHSEGSYRYEAFVEEQIRPEISTNRGTYPNPQYKDPPDIDRDKSYEESVDASGLAAELSLLWRVTQNWSLWTGYDRVYRYPVLDETAAYQGFELAEPVNADLDPETGNQFDLGVKGRTGKRTFSATLFHLDLDDEIVYDSEARLNTNLADTRRIGGEVAFSWESSNIGISTRWSFVEARFRDGPYKDRKVPLVPEVHGTSSLLLRPWKAFSVTLHHRWFASRYQGNDFTNTFRRIPSFHRFDARISLKHGAISAFLQVNNLLDHKHAPLAYRGAWYPAPGRQWRMGLRMRF